MMRIGRETNAQLVHLHRPVAAVPLLTAFCGPFAIDLATKPVTILTMHGTPKLLPGSKALRYNVSIMCKFF